VILISSAALQVCCFVSTSHPRRLLVRNNEEKLTEWYKMQNCVTKFLEDMKFISRITSWTKREKIILLHVLQICKKEFIDFVKFCGGNTAGDEILFSPLLWYRRPVLLFVKLLLLYIYFIHCMLRFNWILIFYLNILFSCYFLSFIIRPQLLMYQNSVWTVMHI
jgi:hypothetical protein